MLILANVGEREVFQMLTRFNMGGGGVCIKLTWHPVLIKRITGSIEYKLSDIFTWRSYPNFAAFLHYNKKNKQACVDLGTPEIDLARSN